MASAADLATFRKAQNDVVALAYRELTAYWKSLDVSDPIAVVQALEKFLPGLIQDYGEVGAAIAADFYDELRDQNPNVRAGYRSVMGDAVPLEAVKASTRWAVTPIFRELNPDPVQALSNVTSITDRFVKAQGRSTIISNVQRDPAQARFARVPQGATCAFCLMLASRGAVYHSEAAAGEMKKFHSHCDCVPTPVWDGDALPEGYDPKGLSSIYQRGLQDAESGSLKGSDGVLAAIRRQQGVS